MSHNTQLPVAIHILVSLTLRDECLNSEALAWSIGTNASTVRRILGPLRKAGLVVSRAGPTGGVRLAKSARSISLLEVLHAVDATLSLATHSPNPECPLGAVVGDPLAEVLDEVEAAAEGVLAKKTVYEIAEATRKRIAGRGRSRSRPKYP